MKCRIMKYTHIYIYIPFKTRVNKLTGALQKPHTLKKYTLHKTRIHLQAYRTSIRFPTTDTHRK